MKFSKKIIQNLKKKNFLLASPRATLRIPCYFAHRLQHLKMKENDNSMIKNNFFFSLVAN